MENKFKLVLLPMFMALLLSACWYVYLPGLNGGFLLDDQASLGLLKIIDGDPTTERLYDYFAASRTGILKRPISVFSFLIDAQNWPAAAYSFKKTNLIIHLINGGMLFVLLFSLFFMKTESFGRALMVSFLATAFWLLNPFLVSTTLYVVQRMAMLPASFTLLGLIHYLYLRKKYQLQPSKPLGVLLVLNVGAFALLAALCKENGILYVFLVALFEYLICVRWLSFRPLDKVFQWMAIKLPVIALVVVICLMIPGAVDGYDFRAFNMYERVLTQFRALTVYLYHLFVPDYFTEGVFTDGFGVSKGVMSPASTIFSIIFIMALMFVSWLARKKYVWLTFSVGFFFLAHVLESTVFPLEMYFEHRNYLSALFVFVPLALLIVWLINQSKIYILVAITILGMWFVTTQQRVTFWGNEILLHEESMKLFPESVRARTLNAILYDNSGLKYDALRIIEGGLEINESIELRANVVLLRCALNSLEASHVTNFISALKSEQFDKDDLNPMDALMQKMMLSGCKYQFTHEHIKAVLDAFEVNPVTEKNSGRSWVDFYWAKYYLYLQKDMPMAYDKYMSAFDAMPDITILFDGINDLSQNGEIKLAKKMLEKAASEYKQQYAFKPDWQEYGAQLDAIAEKVNLKNEK